MIITRKNSLDLLDIVLEAHVKSELEYWIAFHNILIPVDTVIYLAKAFIETPLLSSIELPEGKFQQIN